MDKDRDTAEHVTNLLEELSVLAERLSAARAAREIIKVSLGMEKTAADLAAMEADLAFEAAELTGEIVGIVVDAEINAAKAAKRIDDLEAALRETHPKAPPIWSGWSL